MSSLLIRSPIPLRNDFEGGADQLMVRIGAALGAEGWDVHLLSPWPRSGGADNDVVGTGSVTVHEFDYRAPGSPFGKIANTVRGAGTFRRLCDRHDFDVVLDDVSHIPFYPLHFLAPESATNAVFLHTLYLSTAPRYVGRFKGRVIHLLERTLPHLADPTIVCAGPSTEARVHDGLGWTETEVLRPCVDLEELRFEPAPRSKTVLSLGRLTVRKNVRCLLDAWREVEDRLDGYELVIAGTGREEERLRERADRLGLDAVEFRGYVDHEEKVDLLATASLFVLPSLMEGYVTTGLEALGSGTPVVGSDTWGVNDYVTDGDNGVLVPPDDPAALADAISTAASDPSTLSRMAERGRETAEQHSFDRFGRRADDVFTALAEDDG